MEVKVKSLNCVRLFATPWTVAYQAPPSMGFSRQEYWSGLPFPSPGDLPDPGTEPWSPALRADTLTSEPQGNQGRATHISVHYHLHWENSHDITDFHSQFYHTKLEICIFSPITEMI